MKKKLLAVFLGATLVLGACGGGNKTKENGAGEQVSADPGEKVYQANCASCHGDNLQGRGGPALDKVGSKFSEEEIHDIIVNGIPGTSMPGGLVKDESEQNALAKWLASKK